MTDQLDSSVSELVQSVHEALGHSPDFVHHVITSSSFGEVHYFFIDTMVNSERVDQFLLQPIMDQINDNGLGTEKLITKVPGSSLKILDSSESCIKSLLDGCIIFISVKERIPYALNFSKIPSRALSEPTIETTVRGPKEAFNEDIKVNVSLLRKRIKSTHLTHKQFYIGSETQTEVLLIYMNNLVPNETIEEVIRRLNAISTDSIFESSYIEEWIQDTSWTPFPLMRSTERPDSVAAHLMEGAFGILVEGSPIAIIGPITFFQMFNSPEDYYERADIATLVRWLRMLSFMLAVFVPSIYIAMITYHQEILPVSLLVSLSLQREGVPFPAFLEAFLMMVTFEILREAGLRMPRVAGQAISIVGALVLGQSAVEAGVVSASMVIVVSITAIANFVAPTYSFGIAQRILQYSFMVLTALFGLYGLTCGVLILLTHLVSLRSFGVKYFTPLAPVNLKNWKDILIRVPRPQMKSKRRFLAGRNTRK